MCCEQMLYKEKVNIQTDEKKGCRFFDNSLRYPSDLTYISNRGGVFSFYL